ncbi:MAG: potassium transporter KefB [Rufibacter sp.]
MSQEHNPTAMPTHSISFIKPVLVGAGIAFLVISFFVFGADYTKPEWGEFWRIKPLVVTPLAGALGGACYAFLKYQSSRGLNKTLALILGVLIYVIGLWMGVVVGLDGTMWD